MSTTPITRALAVAAIAISASAAVCAQGPLGDSTGVDLPLFAVEITTGPKWDQSKPPQEQLFFRAHSSNLKRLRDSGQLILGARYSDRGLVVLAARDEADARAMMDEDPSIKAEVFKYQLHPFSVFYGGTIHTRPRRPPP